MLEIHFHWDVLLFALLVLGLYAYGLLRLRPSPQWLYPVEKKQVVFFAFGMLGFVAVQGTPFHDLSNHSFSVHMAQHMVLTLGVPPLILLGIPPWFIRPLIRHRITFAIAKVLTHPIFAMGSFNATLAIWHVPLLYDVAVWDYKVHILNHWMYLATAILLWWPIYSPLRELPRLSYPVQMLYLFVQSLVPAVLASIITFAEESVYVAYQQATPIWSWSVMEDQQIGGLIMKVGGGTFLWILAIVIFFNWFSQEEAEVEKSWD